MESQIEYELDWKRARHVVWVKTDDGWMIWSELQPLRQPPLTQGVKLTVKYHKRTATVFRG